MGAPSGNIDFPMSKTTLEKNSWDNAPVSIPFSPQYFIPRIFSGQDLLACRCQREIIHGSGAPRRVTMKKSRSCLTFLCIARTTLAVSSWAEVVFCRL